MKRIYLFMILMAFFLYLPATGQDQKEEKADNYKLTSEKLDAQEKELDEQLLNLNKKIADVIKRYELLKIKNIRILPYQTEYSQGDDYITIEKHTFIKDEIFNSSIIGINSKKIKIYTNGETVTKVESEILEHNHQSENKELIKIIDPSPIESGTDDIIFSRIINGKLVFEKKMGEIKNTTAFPVRSDLKQRFLVSHMVYFYNSILYIAESYYKSQKDSDAGMTDFLEKSTTY